MADFIKKSAIFVFGVPETIRTSDPFLRSGFFAKNPAYLHIHL